MKLVIRQYVMVNSERQRFWNQPKEAVHWLESGSKKLFCDLLWFSYTSLQIINVLLIHKNLFFFLEILQRTSLLKFKQNRQLDDKI